MTAIESIRIMPCDPSMHILFVHGYTSSPKGFEALAQALSERLNADVHVPLLPGHGTREEDLLTVSYDDLLQAVRAHAASRPKGIPFVCIGYSFGGFLAAEVTAEHHADGLVVALTPYVLTFPLTMPLFQFAVSQFRFVSKLFTREDRRLREGSFYYPHLPGASFAMEREGTERLRAVLPRLAAPLLALYNTDDPVVSSKSAASVLNMAQPNPLSRARIFTRGRHTMFFGPYKDEPIHEVVTFLQEIMHKKSRLPKEAAE